MSYSNFNRGRGFGPPGTRAARRFGRPHFPRPPFRHVGPPRPGHPVRFGMPWQPNNVFFQPHPLRGSPQFRADGRRRRFGNYDIRFPTPNRLPVPQDHEEFASDCLQMETDQDEAMPPLLGSEEERQRKIAETADRLKQKLSSFSSDEITDIWNEDAPPSCPAEDDCIENPRVPVVGYKSSELNLTYNDLKDIGKINPDYTKLDDAQYPTDICNFTSNADSNVTLDENENGSRLAIPSDQMTNLEDVPNDSECAETDSWVFHEPVDNSHNLGQLDVDNNIDLLESDREFQRDIPLAGVSQDQDDQQHDAPREIGVYPANAASMQEESETLNLQAASFPIDSAGQEILQKEDEERSQNEEGPVANLEVQESVLILDAESPNNSGSTLTQLASADVPMNNVTLDNQLPRVMESSFHGGPPRLSPHTEQELPVDFDPSTPPPILLKQEQSRILPPYSIPPELPPLFDPTAPPPNIKCLLGSQEDVNPAWSNAQNPMPAVYSSVEVHAGLNTHGGFILQPPLEMPGQSNVFLPPHVDSVNFPPIFPMPSSSHSGMSTHVPSILPQMHATPHNTFVPPHVLPELPPSSDLSYSVNKDDGLDDMQEAMKFAIEMTGSVTGRADEESRSSPKSLSVNNILINRVSDVEFISLPPERPRAKINKVKRMRETVTRSKKEMVPEERSTADYLSPEEILQDANVRSKDALLIKEQDRPKVVFNLNNKTKVVSTKKVRQEISEKKNGMTQSVESEKTRATPSVTRKNLENTLRRNKEEKKSLKRNENNSECTTLFELITSKNATLPHRTPQKDVNMEKCSNVSPSRVAVQKELRSPVETSENSTTEALWKNKIISRFLKMSKNDIYNMVNDTSLRKFDIIMKRLVKEKKPTLSLKMRHVQDEKMKSYDQQEFMKQLNAMLDTDAVVSITDLPTEFIHHLNEVLQLDVQPDNHAEPAAASSSQCGQSESTNYAFSPVIDNVTECANKTARSNNVRRKNVKNKGRTTKTPYNKSVEAHDIIKNNNLNTKDDTCNTIVASEICNTVIANDICNSIVANDSSISSNLLTLQHDLDDIFSKVTKKNQIPAAAKERKRCDMSYVDAISRSMEEALLEDEMHNLESSPRWDEKCDRWKRKEREDPHAYRNLTKEEWEERYGTQPSSTPFSADNIAADNNEPLPRRGRGRKLYLRRRYSSESSKHPPNTRHRSLEKDKHKKSRRHSDDRRHSTGYLEYNASHDSNSSSSSTSSSSSNSSSTNSSDNANVTKLLRVIKENEKVAKQVSLNEAIRDEVNAEIERDRRSRKLRKHSKNRKQRKARHKKKRKQDKETSSSNSSSEKDDNDEATDRLLTESEIKKEVVENQITQEVIIKEEVDIGQEENVDAEFANATSLVVENRAAYLLSAPQNIPESPFEIPPATANATQLHTEDRLPTASPTHPKTKAQLKQMPETSDMNDNKVSLNVFTCVPEDWNTFNPANLSKSAEDLSRSCETADNGCDQDSSVLSTIDNCTSQNGNAVSCGKADKDASPQQQVTTARTFTESSPKVQDDNEIVATDNNVSRVLRQDNVSTVSTSASSASDISPPSTVIQKQGASKKIDIKTYYERTIQRRMNEKLEMKKPVENPAISTPIKPSTSKVTGPEIAVKKPTYSGSIQDPRLLSARVAIASINNKVDISQTTSRKNVRQKEAQVTKGSTNAEPAPRCPEGKNSNPTIDSDSVVKQINEDKTKDKVPPAANNIKILSNVVVTPKIAVPKFKKCSEVKKRTDKNSQSKVSSDETKRFKNIRSEGGKELKLKKETAGEQKAKKKSAVTSKSVSFVSTNVYIPLEEAVQEKKIDNNSNTSKMENKRLVDSRETKIDNSNTKTELSTISSENADNDGNELSHDTVKAKRSSNCDIERENAKKTVSNIEGADAHEHSSKTMRSKVTRNVKRAKNVAGVEIADKKGQIARETCSVVPELNVSTSKVAAEVPENKVTSDIEKIKKKSSSASKVQPINAAKSTGFSSSYVGQSKIKKSKSAISRETSSNSELDGLDGPSKEENQLLIDSNIKTSDIKDNNTVLNAVGALKSASANEDESVAKKTAESSSASKENSQQGATSSDSVGSPFKGFLQETMIDFEQPNLFNMKLEVDANKKNTIFLDDCNVNYAMRAASCKDTTIEGQQDYEALESSTNYANDADVNASENFNIAFGNALLASDKECTTTKKGDEPRDLAMNESREEDVKRSPSEIAATTLHDEDNDINIGGGNETEGQLMSKGGYASCAGLVMKESMFISEEEVIQGEARSKDLASKLKTTTDPSLSDALETTISDDALRLPESQGAEHLDNHMYLETNISAEKAACDKLPGFDADEHLDSDIFYLDDRLRSTTAFDNKDEESVHFPVHQQSLRYDITLAVTPETTMITPCADLSKPEVCKFDLKHVSSTDNDLLAGGASAERSSGDTPRTLNIPTKAALKEAATNLFLKYPSNVSTATKEMALEVLDKQGETDLNYQAPAWHVNRQNNIKTRPQETRNNTRAQDFINVNTISSTQSSTYDEPAHNNMDVGHGNSVSVKPRGDMEKFLHGGLQRNPVVELRKMTELDGLLEQRRQGNSEKVKKSICEGKKKHNGTILRKIKDKRQIKCRGKETSSRISLVKRLKRMRQSGKLVSTTKEAILARMLEIDLEMHKLATEKLKLHEILQNVPSTENSAANSGAISRAREDESVVQPEVPEIPSTLMAQEASETSCAKRAKHVLPSRPSARQRKRISSRNSENEETSCTPVYQKTKMPVIKWKKKPRLEQIVRREEEEEDDEEKDLAETTEQQISTSAGKEAKDGSSEDASEDNVQRPEPNAVVDDEAREEQTTEKPDEEAVCDVIDSGRTISSDKSTADKIADDRSEWQGFADDETERTKYPDIDKRDNVLPPSEEAARTSCRQVHSTPEPSSIYSDDSTWNSITQNTASEVHEIRTGLVLLEQTLKKQLVKSRKMEAIVRKKKKRQLDAFLRTVNKLTMEEEELPLSKLYITKLQQKRDLLDSLSRKKEDADLVVDPDMKNLDKVINAVAENRVEDLYEPPLEARASDEVPATSNNASSVLQPDKDQFYVDAEANANSDWPCREKENVEEVALQQNDVPDADGSNHVFKAVSQDKVPFYNDRNVEPDSSITPEETLTENHSSDCERLKDSNNIASRNIDIKVSVPKILIKDDFSLGLLQKLQDTEAGVAGAGLVDSTTNVLSASSEKEGDKSSRDTSQAVETLAKESNKDEKGEMKEKHAVNASEKEETVDSVSNAPSVPQSNVAKSGYSDATENEESGDSAASNRCDKVATTDTGRDLSVSYSAVEKSDTKQKELDAEPEQLSNDATALKQDCQSLENAVAEEEKSNPENKSHAFERILDNDQSTSNSIPVDLVNEGSEESNEASVEPKSSLERTFTTFSFNKAAAKGAETSRKLRRKQDSSTPTRRSTRKSNENIKSIRIKEADANSNSSERDSTILHERNVATRSRSKSPTWAMRDESVTSNESAFSNNSTVAIAKKRKQHTEWQMKNCKVQVVDCKSVLLKYVNSDVLDRLGIIVIDDSSCVHHTTSNQNTVTPTTASGDSFFLSDRPCYKENLEIEILDEKPVMESNDKALTRESVLQVAEIDEEESTKLEYTIHKGPILDIKVFENSFLAASEDNKIYRYSQMSSEILNIYEGHKSAVTCLYVCKSDIVGVNKELMYSGSLDGTLRCYNITTGELVKNPAQVNSAIQCMDQAWGIIFIGTKSGHVSRFHITAGAIKGNSIPFSDKSVLALKATNEGPRRILIVASRNQPITIRDAQTGLFLRTISGQKNHITVYSLLRHNNLIYCGTSGRSINVFDFTTGEQVIQYDAGVGIVCMRLHKQLLFAGCYDGNIYVFDINNHKLVCSIQGPGNMLLSVEVVNNKIIAGSKDKRLHSWQMPTQVRALL
ncbi:PREDICTED: uncharacterized protein LOC105562524 isoform X2 [Vollenhovia emeryi]|uniref:uncharacterized protein LOC105562524 isoform X2 n=1 Tax=Vollenhovia emeryi TaxID=411798 RepID=UPI0005F53235|nr:PREDICTED: uncharacterized protein LOC105562524 isoform X2 [Vollenhovia emeryi]